MSDFFCDGFEVKRRRNNDVDRQQTDVDGSSGGGDYWSSGGYNGNIEQRGNVACE